MKNCTQIFKFYFIVCKEDGSVEFTGFKQGSHVKIISTAKGVMTNCSNKDLPTVSSRGDVVSITVDCMGKNLKVIGFMTAS